jgi:hypothetical protein
MVKTILLPPQQSESFSLHTARIRSSLILAISILLSFVLSSATVAAQAATQITAAYGQGTITTDVSPAITSSRTMQTPAQHAGASAGTITTSVSSVNAAAEILGTPVKHAGQGVITTSVGLTIPAAAQTLDSKAGALTPLAAAPSFTVSAACAADSVGVMTITNVGGDMPVPFTWRLNLNGTPIAQDTFQLNAGQTFNLSTSGLFGTLTLEVLDTSNTVVASGSTFCQSPPPPSFTVSAACAANAVGVMTITNVGGNMPVPFTWRLNLNGTPIAQNTFQLNAGQTFNLSTSGLFGTLTLEVLDTSNTVVASGSMFCQSPPPPSFTVSAACAANSSGIMTITNVGGDMPVPFTWRLSLNGTPIAQNTFQLNAGQTFNLSTSGLYGTLTLDVLDTSNTVVASGSMVCQSPSFTVSAACAANATGVMTITNVGGDMPVPFTWRLNLNGTPIAQNTFQLNAGQTFNLSTSGLFGTLTLEVLDTSNTVVASGSMFCPSSTVSVPNVVNLTQAAATTAITGAGLVVGTVTTASSSIVPSGSVISQTPAAGASVAAGSAVNLVVSSGALLGDVNGDGFVNCTDLAIIKASFGKRSGQSGFDGRADTNHDGVIDLRDLSFVSRLLPTGTRCP